MTALRLGTRRSRLALAQSGEVARQVEVVSGRKVELVEITTLGDLSSAPITQLGGTGVFVTALREALLRREVDFVVHSCKDLPAADFPGLTTAAVPPREDPRDALVWPGGTGLRHLPEGARVGTGSARRAAELVRLGLPVDVVSLRGNVDTRLKKVETGELDAVVLAAAGLVRLGLADVITEMIDPELILPAPAQGALAVECRTEDVELWDLLSTMDDPISRLTMTAERSFLASLDAGCTAPVGAYAQVLPRQELQLEGFTAGKDLRNGVRTLLTGPAADPTGLGRALAGVVLSGPDLAAARRQANP